MYDPMIAKLIVWDADREQATARMLRALGEYEIGGLKTLMPFHKAILATRPVGQRRDLSRPDRGQKWLKTLQQAPPEAPSEDDEEAQEKVEQTYMVEVSGKRFDVRVVGPPFAGGGGGAGVGAVNGAAAGAAGAVGSEAQRPCRRWRRRWRR